ncbi:MAG: hypothetical protein FJW31_09010 [Acidobacteria bacterium]|nr:hypothetical protein [Acidobacteriota bacterium]
MDKAALVSLDIAEGFEIAGALEHAHVKPNAALLAYLSEYEDWRLLILSRQFDTGGLHDAYRRLNEVLSAAGVDPRNTPIQILPTSDPFFRELRRPLAKSKNAEGKRLGGQLFGDRFVEDGYVYRVA